MKDHSFWEIGNGEEVDLFKDSWKQLLKLQEEGELSILQVHLEREGFTKVKDFWENNGGASPFRQWQSEELFSGWSLGEEVWGLI